MTRERKWHPISDILIIGKYISDLLGDSKSQYELLQEAKETPSSMDDEIIDRTKKLFTDRGEIIKLYEDQVKKWEKEANRPFDKEEVVRLKEMIVELWSINGEILKIADYIGNYTIEKILNMADGELAIKTMLGEIPAPKRNKE